MRGATAPCSGRASLDRKKRICLPKSALYGLRAVWALGGHDVSTCVRCANAWPSAGRRRPALEKGQLCFPVGDFFPRGIQQESQWKGWLDPENADRARAGIRAENGTPRTATDIPQATRDRPNPP